MTATILCIEDQPAARALLEHTLTRLGHPAMLVSSVEEGMRAVARTPVDLVIAGCGMPGLTGLDLLARLEGDGRRIPVCILTGPAVEHAAASLESGAIDYLTTPIEAQLLELAVRRALEVVRLRRENEAFRREIGKLRGRQALIGDSGPFRQVMEALATLAPSRGTVLLHGETGTGKGLFARAIHDLSPRADRPFVTVNCGALPDGLVESVLFGHEEGEFTGASVPSPGVFERAHEGTLVLEDIAGTRPELQSKLLRVIVGQEFQRIGGREAIRVDVRLIATTDRDLAAEVQAGRFRGDLYSRLSAFPVRIPSLRERQEDVPLLVHYFLARSAGFHGRSPSIGPEMLEILRRLPWPGNVRELAGAVERAVLLCRGDLLQPGDFDPVIRDAAAHPLRPALVPAGGGPSPEAIDYNLEVVERRAIERALAATGGKRAKAARLLGISERTLRNKLNCPRAASGG